jgi:hypothetical protein
MKRVKHNFPKNWDNQVVQIWHEDECLRDDPDAEKLWATPGSPGGIQREGAWKRITGLDFDEKDRIAEADHGDTSLYLHRGGWVEINSYDGCAVGIVVEVKEPVGPTGLVKLWWSTSGTNESGELVIKDIPYNPKLVGSKVRVVLCE